jgi:hypothetical protein
MRAFGMGFAAGVVAAVAGVGGYAVWAWRAEAAKRTGWRR